MELELGLGSGNCSDTTRDCDDESRSTSSDTQQAVVLGTQTGLEFDLGNNPPATGLGGSVFSLKWPPTSSSATSEEKK